MILNEKCMYRFKTMLVTYFNAGQNNNKHNNKVVKFSKDMKTKQRRLSENLNILKKIRKIEKHRSI